MINCCWFSLMWYCDVCLTIAYQVPGVCLLPHTHALLLLVQDVGFRVTHPKPCPDSESHTQKTGSLNKCVTMHTHLSQIYIPVQRG